MLFTAKKFKLIADILTEKKTTELNLASAVAISLLKLCFET